MCSLCGTHCLLETLIFTMFFSLCLPKVAFERFDLTHTSPIKKIKSVSLNAVISNSVMNFLFSIDLLVCME